MPDFTLARSSRLYRFVFGQQEGRMDGFPEPRSDRISSGLFVGLLLAAAFLRSFSTCMFFFMEAMIKLISFLVNGSRTQGRFLSGFKITPIEPWPRVFGRRVSLWPLFVAIVVGWRYVQFGVEDAGQFLLFFGFLTAVFWYTGPDSKSGSEIFAEKVGPKMEEKLRSAYYRESKIFPILHLVN